MEYGPWSFQLELTKQNWKLQYLNGVFLLLTANKSCFITCISIISIISMSFHWSSEVRTTLSPSNWTQPIYCFCHFSLGSSCFCNQTTSEAPQPSTLATCSARSCCRAAQRRFSASVSAWRKHQAEFGGILPHHPGLSMGHSGIPQSMALLTGKTRENVGIENDDELANMGHVAGFTIKTCRTHHQMFGCSMVQPSICVSVITLIIGSSSPHHWSHPTLPFGELGCSLSWLSGLSSYASPEKHSLGGQKPLETPTESMVCRCM